MYTVAPTYGHHYHTMPSSMSSVPVSTHGSSAPIAHPQSFSVPMTSAAATTSHQTPAPTAAAPATTTAPPPVTTGTTQYTYSAPHVSAYYSTPMTSYHYSPYMFQAAAAAAVASPAGTSVSAGPTASNTHAAGGSGIAPLPAPPLSNRWTDDEVARLRQLAADRSTQVNGKTDWNLVANQFGPTRS
jgi:hypothetical protein